MQDFNRDVRCLFGLPVDDSDMGSTKAWLREKAVEKGAAVLATVNVNWVVQCLRDPAFRADVRNSDLVVLDGKPLLWLARLLGYPMTEVVPGSSLIQGLREESGDEGPLSVFLFGGDEGVADDARERIDAESGGLRAAGALSPGFGTIEQMSTGSIAATINSARPDIVLVALGARKGTQWIEHNRHRLEVGTISHLGATINFLAGNVRRAPMFFRRFGIEWIWHILEEPRLAARYTADGIALLRAVLARLPLWFWYRYRARRFSQDDPVVHREQHGGSIHLAVGRNGCGSPHSPVRQLLRDCAFQNTDIVVDFRKTVFTDGAFVALLLILLKHQHRNGKELRLVNIRQPLAGVFRLLGIEDALLTGNGV